MNTKADFKILKLVADQNTFEILIGIMKKMNIEQQQTKPFDYWCKKNQTNILIQKYLYMSS